MYKRQGDINFRLSNQIVTLSFPSSILIVLNTALGNIIQAQELCINNNQHSNNNQGNMQFLAKFDEPQTSW
jgi:hypothetical protein